jgi:hypothetical protein
VITEEREMRSVIKDKPLKELEDILKEAGMSLQAGGDGEVDLRLYSG